MIDDLFFSPPVLLGVGGGARGGGFIGRDHVFEIHKRIFTAIFFQNVQRVHHHVRDDGMDAATTATATTTTATNTVRSSSSSIQVGGVVGGGVRQKQIKGQEKLSIIRHQRLACVRTMNHELL